MLCTKSIFDTILSNVFLHFLLQFYCLIEDDRIGSIMSSRDGGLGFWQSAGAHDHITSFLYDIYRLTWATFEGCAGVWQILVVDQLGSQLLLIFALLSVFANASSGSGGKSLD